MNDNKIIIKKEVAEQHGIELDQHGFPTEASLLAYHNRTNGENPNEPPVPVNRRVLHKEPIPTVQPVNRQ